ncbi:lachesin isoform X2 [Condylostylus longicornis]|uniref:lachesin isoform X2 n=1 Tax=Condylostylus longicornis TaxID=2530218 RepID=UPI00244E126F|nr:lachesin isoform X2 [Condylostylus longicornis]
MIMRKNQVIYFTLMFLVSECHQTSTQFNIENQQNLESEPEFLGSINNVTYPAGREAILACSVRNLGKYKVGWLRASDQTVLALQGRVVTHNSRISVVFEDMHTWKLRISKLRETDRGCYMCQINTSPMKKQVGCIDVQVPPDIVNEESSADLAVQEGEDATLTCKATGNPLPRITWRREDNDVILIRKPGTRELMKVDSYNGSSLRLSRLERRQMGAYLCIASNDVPPAQSKRVSLSVHFAPMVHAASQLLGAPLGSDVQLECQVEASPAPVSYWLKGGRISTVTQYGGIGNTGLEPSQPRPEMLLDGPKYGISEQRDGYKGVMLLVVRSFSAADVGTYHCVSTNSLGRAEGTLRLYEIKLHPGASSSHDEHSNIIGASRGRSNFNSSSTKTNFNKFELLLIYNSILLICKLLFSTS